MSLLCIFLFWFVPIVSCAICGGGASNTCSGIYATSMGDSCSAYGFASTSMGSFTIASANTSTSMGYNTFAQSYASLVIGRYNIISGNSNSWISTDPVFVVGNGVQPAYNRSNALTLLK